MLTVIESVLVLLLVTMCVVLYFCAARLMSEYSHPYVRSFRGIFWRNGFLSQAWFETAWLGLLTVINFGECLAPVAARMY